MNGADPPQTNAASGATERGPRPSRSRLGPITWVALGSSGLIILLVVLLVTHVITPSGETTDFDSVVRRMGADCFGQTLGPPPIPDEVGSAAECQLVSGDVVMYLVACEPRAPGTVGPRAPTLTPEVAQWLCGFLMGDFLYAAADIMVSPSGRRLELASRRTHRRAGASSLMVRVLAGPGHSHHERLWPPLLLVDPVP
jgi:hypothetical protein